MGAKDFTQKTLEAFPDVFADCMNALLYRGKEHLKAISLHPAPTETIYPDTENILHNQFQDISKFDVSSGDIRIQYTMENQTDVEKRMILRKSGYEGAIYRTQFQTGASYPTITIVLYWGSGQWTGATSLLQLMESKFSAEEQKYIDDSRLHVFEMAHLPAEVRERFHSDMRIVVDCLAEGEKYVPPWQKVVHMEALCRFLRAITGDERYEEMITLYTAQKDTEDTIMCKFLDAFLNEKVEKGMAQGSIQSLVGITRSMCQNQLNAETIAKLINQQLDYINEIISLMQQYPEEDDLSIAKRLLA